MTCVVTCLGKVAAPDTLVVLAADLGIVVGSENLSVTGLALVAPALGHGAADAVETGQGGDLAEPSTDEDVEERLEVGLAGGKDLAVGAGVELVLHDTVALNDDVHGVVLELGVALEGLHAHLRAPLGDDVHVATGGRSRSSGGGGWLGCLAGRGWGRRSVVGGGRRSGLVDHGGGGLGRLAGGRRGRRRRCVDGRAGGLDGSVGHGALGRGLVGRAHGAGGLGDVVALSDVDSLDDGLNDNMDVLDVLVLVAVGTVRGSGERRASEGRDGEGDSRAHLD
jgi:hypothetical protein